MEEARLKLSLSIAVFALWFAAPAIQGDMSEKQAIEIAKQALSDYLKADAASFEVVEVEAVTWPNPALGCAQPGLMYPQVIVPGYRLRLTHQGVSYPVHVGGDRGIVCEQADVAEQARKQLAEKLGLAPEEVSLIGAEKVTWPDTSLGCPKPGEMYAQMVVEGFKVELLAAGSRYVFHAGSDRKPFLCEQAQN